MKLTWIFRTLFLFLVSSSSLMLYSLAQSICIAFSLFLIWDLSCWHSDVTPAKNIMRINTKLEHIKKSLQFLEIFIMRKKNVYLDKESPGSFMSDDTLGTELLTAGWVVFWALWQKKINLFWYIEQWNKW